MADQKQQGAPQQDKGRRDPREGGSGKRYEGFEGMNYEQPRQPFNQKYISRNRSNDERKDGKRPDEG